MAAQRTSHCWEVSLKRMSVARVRWPKKDPGECTTDQVGRALTKALSTLDLDLDQATTWKENTEVMQQRYQRHIKEDHG